MILGRLHQSDRSIHQTKPLASLRGSARLRCAKNHGAHFGARLKKRCAQKEAPSNG